MNEENKGVLYIEFYVDCFKMIYGGEQLTPRSSGLDTEKQL